MRGVLLVVIAGCVVNPNGPVGPRPQSAPSGTYESGAPAAPASAGGAPTADGGHSAPANPGAAPGSLGGAPGVGSASGCFAGNWRGALDRGGAKYKLRVDLRQSGAQLTGTLELRGYEGIAGTAKLAGTADCAAQTATFESTSTTGEAMPSKYTIKLLHRPGYPLNFEGTFTCADPSCSQAEISGELETAY